MTVTSEVCDVSVGVHTGVRVYEWHPGKGVGHGAAGKGPGSHGTTRWLSSFPLPLALLSWAHLGSVGQERVKADPFPETFREKDSTSSVALLLDP